MKLPTENGRRDPIYKAPTAKAQDPAHGAAFIFLHGLGDEAEGLENVADQFQSASKLPHVHWIIPNARENHDALMTAWYTPNDLSPVAPSRPELAVDEDEDGMMSSVKYIESLIDACVATGIPSNRIVLGGFSQGCAMSLLTDLTSKKYGGSLAGVAGLMGYLPLAEGGRIQELRAEAELPVSVGSVPVFLAKGGNDRLIPRRVWNYSLKKLEELGLSDVQSKEYEGLGHSLNGEVLRDMCSFLERIVPKLED